ncbi:4'-phosphopantetheinyl transferase family protein [Sanguibacter antarcticus]|uniref:4'-phosphopantetheinyl transferase n=1 Tax=Sanguibacter antarcticus TaxID=372484 RepID=A0A2A9E652_9MICO|nr:4'-phosphopantetheinyl transferase superfamily protein [Sanguibacter antarcticus]PFG34324.1 4'-phosphopantetheinyl transferase [Sanguibacter antarcticus]
MTSSAVPVAMIARTADVDVVAPLSGLEAVRRLSLRRAADRDDYTAAHALVRACAARLVTAATGAPPDASRLVLTHRCPGCGSEEHGVPRIDGISGLHVSLSRSDGVVAAVAGWEPVGIDVQAVQALGAVGADAATAPTAARLVAMALSPAEQALVAAHEAPEVAFARLWVRKEALLKVGVGTLDALAGLEVSHGPAPGRHGAWTFTGWEDGTHVAAVAAHGEVRLTVHDDTPAARDTPDAQAPREVYH